jgi:hypothetical protein
MLADKNFFNKLNIGIMIIFPAFSEFMSVKNLNNNTTMRNPIFSSGFLASDPRVPYYSTKDKISGDCLIYEALSRSGASGSPCYCDRNGLYNSESEIPDGDDQSHGVKCIGINAGHIKERDGTHSGISYFYKSYLIKEIIEEMA